MGPKLLRNVSNARMAPPAPLASGDARSNVRMAPPAPPASGDARALAVSLLLLLTPLVLAACSGSETSRLVITQSTDAPTSPDPKRHPSPGVFTGLTLPIGNPAAGAPR